MMLNQTAEISRDLPKLHDEHIGELLVIVDDLSGFSATYQLIMDHIAEHYQDGPKVFRAVAEGKSVEFLLTALEGIRKDLSQFIERNRPEDDAA
jgi:hypothetical protein